MSTFLKRATIGLFLSVYVLVALLTVELSILIQANSQATTFAKNGYGYALGVMLFVMLCISAWIGYRFALTRETTGTVQNLKADLLLAQKTLDKLSQTHADLLWVQDPQGVYASCSMAFASHCGVAYQELIGAKNDSLLGVNNADVLLQYHQAVLTRSEHASVDLRLTSAQDGLE